MSTSIATVKNDNKVFINHSIRAPKVLAITEDGTNIGVIATFEAIKMALDSGLDLVQVSPPMGGKPPTCKILDYGKFKYEESKKRKASDKKQREMAIEMKQIKFRPTTGQHDLKTKAKKAFQFLEDGNQVKITLVFNGREISHKDVAMETLNEFMTFVDNGEIIGHPFMDGPKFLSVMLGKKNI